MEAVLSKEIVINKTLSRALGVLVFVVLTSLGAFVRIPLPFTPVPLTLQTFFVLLSGALLGGSLGVTAQLSYILLGVLGLPIFTGAGSGLLYLSGPTAGYLFGFVLACLFCAKFIKYSGNNFSKAFGIFCVADFLLLASGTLWLKFLFGYSLTKLFSIGFIPFVLGDLCKAAAAAVVYIKLRPRLK
ncbi:MAG: biotin transporter BioY [Candidatus Omnitrophica bacterium]|nr:biotin transporter BioY [Candidatus Omnitrophota bacterium]